MKKYFLLLSFVLLFQAPAGADDLSDPETGLSLKAPKGYSLSARNGVYTLKGKSSFARFMLARSPYGLNQTVTSYIKSSKIQKAKTSKKGSMTQVTGKLGGKSVIVQFKGKGGSNIDIVTFGSGSTRRSAAIYRVSAARNRLGKVLAADVTIPDILALQRAIASRRGGIAVPLNLTIPMRRFVAPDGGSSALVPNLPGWSFQGGGGVVSGFNAQQGAFQLGIPVNVSLPGFFGSPPISQFVGPDVAIVNVWPQYAALFGSQVRVLSVQQVPGTEGWLGQGTLSALYAVRVQYNGQTWQALFLSASIVIPDLSIGWMWYHSYIAVPENGPGGIGPALMDTWASWDNSGAAQARLRQALQTLSSIRVSGGGPIDPDVFEEAAYKWSMYIRE